MSNEVITAVAATGDALLKAAGAYAVSTAANLLLLKFALRKQKVSLFSAFGFHSVTFSPKFVCKCRFADFQHDDNTSWDNGEDGKRPDEQETEQTEATETGHEEVKPGQDAQG